MNGFPNPNAPSTPAAWQSHNTPDGRTYYHNPSTGQTQWTKPEDLMTPAERALADQPWKEFTAEGGRKYWYNNETRETTWEMPDVFKNIPGDDNAPATRASHTLGGPGSGRHHASYEQQRDHRDNRDTRDYVPESRQLPPSNDSRTQAFVPANEDPEYATEEEAEAAFEKLLKRSGVQSDWTWDQAIRASATDPQFRALRDPRQRKLAFEKYCKDMIAQDKERAQERLTKLRADFETMLKRHPEITHYTRWKTARPMIEGETIFRSTDNESERRQLFEEYIIGLKKDHAEQQTAMRKNAMDGLIELLPKLNLEPYTRWSEAHDLISTTPPFQKEEKYKVLTPFDILTAFQNHMKALERAFNDAKQEEKNKKFRREREARDAFKSLLKELRENGKINAGTKWSQIYPLIASDERYTNMAGSGGSSPQELFWDVIEDEERKLRGPRNDVLDVLEDKRFDLTPSSDLGEFLALMKEDRRTANIDRDTLNLVFDRLREKRASKRDDDKHSDRQQRRAVDDLRSYLKRMEPPVLTGDTYEKLRPRLVKSEEFQAISSEDARKAAFEKHIRRLREKEEDAERAVKRRDRVPSEQDLHRRDRDRSRGERSHRGSGRTARRSRSPEPDAYEADRRKAIAERERNHRKSSMAEGLLSTERGRLSPSARRDRERERDRDRDQDRSGRSRRDDDRHYDRERRDREEERERQYRRRVDRGSHDELPYGDERPAGSRRRRPEEEDDLARRESRDSKRVKRENSPRERSPPRAEPARSRNKSPPLSQPAPATTEQQMPAADEHSGSEEGEII